MRSSSRTSRPLMRASLPAISSADLGKIDEASTPPRWSRRKDPYHVVRRRSGIASVTDLVIDKHWRYARCTGGSEGPRERIYQHRLGVPQPLGLEADAGHREMRTACPS